MTNTPMPGSLGQVLRAKFTTLLLVPVANLVLIVAFWQSQIAHYATSTEGVLIMWLVAGLIFGLIQLSLLVGAWRQAIHEQELLVRTETLWLLGVQIATLCVMTIYSIFVTVKLLRLGVYPNQLLDIVIMAIFGITLFVVGLHYGWRRLTDPSARFWFAAGAKVAPQILQAVGLAWYGSHGMHLLTLLTVVAMTLMRYILAHATVRRQSTPHTKSVHRAAFWDLIAVCAMSAGWCMGRVILLYHYVLVRTLTNRHPGRSRALFMRAFRIAHSLRY